MPPMNLLVRLLVNAVALAVAAWLIPGITLDEGATNTDRAITLAIVAAIFGIVNAFIRPVVKLLALPLIILTLGLITFVINALMLWFTAWITEHTTHWGLYIDDFWWTAIWAAIGQVGAFVVAAVLTPPDVLSQFMLAIPLIILYELSLVAIWFTERKRARDAEPQAS